MNCAELDIKDPLADMGLHDPRLYSNIRGMAAGETSEERVAAHNYISCDAGMGVRQAWREGFYRGGREPGLPVPVLAMILLTGAVVLSLAIRRWRRSEQ